MIKLYIHAFFAGLILNTQVVQGAQVTHGTKSGIKTWVDPATPEDRQTYTSSRGETWELVMSDEFNEPDRDFRPGKDHMWTSIEKPDGVNAALEIYSHDMTSTACDDKGTCYFYIKTIDEVNTVKVYNQYKIPPGYEKAKFYYRGGMVQSWNKFCYQGGMMEVRAQLPGAISKKSGNPDLAKGSSGRVEAGEFYPTWPGIWMMGNLGRAIFSASTNRMWPFSYNECDKKAFEPSFQRISACDSSPGYGLNPNQGRGAPEIDILEGGGVAISSSVQIGPGMPPEYRLIPAEKKYDGDVYQVCMFGSSCKTPGANSPGIPTAIYNKLRPNGAWYKGLRYASNNFCAPNAKDIQDYTAVKNALATGVVENICNVANCPGSKDPNADLGPIFEGGVDRWGINSNGTCFPIMNGYMGSFLCDPDSQNPLCPSPRNDSTPKSDVMKPFEYQMDAISSNWPVQLGAYTDYLTYQVEWVTGRNGYVRWMLDGYPLFEVPAKSITNIPQGGNVKNPMKLMLEEPMYVILNVALSSSWGAKPPNPGNPCRGDGNDPKVNRICDDFPMYLKIDYIRLYQDMSTEREKDDYMQVGCDPKSHPTREWIYRHLEEYEDDVNKVIDVAGKAYCRNDQDCTLGNFSMPKFTTGKCIKKRCVCRHPQSWGGPRCTTAMSDSVASEVSGVSSYGPPPEVAMSTGIFAVVMSLLAVAYSIKTTRRNERDHMKVVNEKKQAAQNMASPMAPKDNYHQNFV